MQIAEQEIGEAQRAALHGIGRIGRAPAKTEVAARAVVVVLVVVCPEKLAAELEAVATPDPGERVADLVIARAESIRPGIAVAEIGKPVNANQREAGDLRGD